MAMGGNPVLVRAFGNSERFGEQYLDARSDTMTVQGTVVKSAVLLACVLATAGVSWTFMQTSPALGGALWMGGLLVALIAGFVLCFWTKGAPFLAPVYALAKGLALGGLTYMIANSLAQSGKVSSAGLFAAQGIVLTLSIFGGLLAAYSFRIIRVSSTVSKVVSTLILGVVLFGVAMMLLSMFGVGRSLAFSIFSPSSGSMLGIGYSVLVVCLASYSLVENFQYIEQGAENQQPKYMEWYGAFGMLVTLLWLYIEIVRLLSKMKNR